MSEADLRQARDQHRVARVIYQRKNQEKLNPMERDIEVFALHPPYVAGYCRLRQDIRLFRIDNLARVLLLDETFPWDQRIRMASIRAIEGIKGERVDLIGDQG
jgi:predicted DNA-binding transcriptional regulator YafY